MSLPVTAYLDSSEFLNGGYFASVGEYPSCKPPNVNGFRRAYHYYDRLDCIVQQEVGSQHGNRWAVRLDANFIDNSSVSCKWGNPGELGVITMAVGEWDMQLNTQKFYWADTETQWKELDVDNMSDDGAVYVGIIDPRGQDNGLSWPGDPYGYWGADSCQIFFETLNRALVLYARANIPGGGVDTNSHRPILVDLTTGNAVENVPFTTRYTGSPVDDAESPPFKGETFELQWGQFVPDDDSTPANPKGYLLLAQSNAGLAAGTWIKQVDWNPNGVSPAEGQPARTHCQTRLLSKFQPTQGSWPGACPVADTTYQCPIARRSDDTWMFIWGTDVDGPHSPGECGRATIGQQATPVALTRPVFIGRPKTNSIATAVSTFVGDLGERISGLSATWSLKKASEYREILPTTGTPDEVVYVDNPPIDDQHLVEVYLDGDLLDPMYWSISAGGGDADTGAVRLYSPHSGSGVYEMRYRHVENPVAGARTNLLTPAATSDDYGNIYARIRIEDDDELIGEWEHLSATEEA